MDNIHHEIMIPYPPFLGAELFQVHRAIVRFRPGGHSIKFVRQRLFLRVGPVHFVPTSSRGSALGLVSQSAP